ncbi:MAG: hypothetical protein ACHQX3_11475, partial [Nitrospirales bacterium]
MIKATRHFEQQHGEPFGTVLVALCVRGIRIIPIKQGMTRNHNVSDRDSLLKGGCGAVAPLASG